MTMTFKPLFMTCCLLFFTAACTLSPTIHSNYNQAIDFNQYKTFGFFEPLDTDTRYESLVSQYLKQATIAEMTQRGFVFSSTKPDLLINFHSQTESKQNIHQIPTSGYNAPYFQYQGRFYYDTWVSYRTFIDDYQEGTLNIDIVDNQLNKMVWQGVAVGRMTEDQLKHLQTTLQQNVSDIFRQFPINIQP